MASEPGTHTMPLSPPGRSACVRATFADAVAAGADFHDLVAVIDGARRSLAAGHAERALRLLAIAIEESPREELLWLARLKILSLAGMRSRFVHAMCDFMDAHPGSANFVEVTHLWKGLRRL